MITREIRQGEVFADRYRVIRRLGVGGMATVWLAEDERLGREVAIKRLRTGAPEESLTRFRREARIGATLNHPNLVSVFDTIATEEGALIVMEYVPGRSLEELAAPGPMDPEEVVSILRGSRPPWITPIGRASFTVTSSRRTSWFATTGRSRWPTWALRARWTRRRSPPRER